MKRYYCLAQWPFDMDEASDGEWVSFDDAQKAIADAVAAERERCAKLCEERAAAHFPMSPAASECEEMAAAIRGS